MGVEVAVWEEAWAVVWEAVAALAGVYITCFPVLKLSMNVITTALNAKVAVFTSFLWERRGSEQQFLLWGVCLCRGMNGSGFGGGRGGGMGGFNKGVQHGIIPHKIRVQLIENTLLGEN